MSSTGTPKRVLHRGQSSEHATRFREFWSECQDLNLRPARPERGSARHERWGSHLGFYIQCEGLKLPHFRLSYCVYLTHAVPPLLPRQALIDVPGARCVTLVMRPPWSIASPVASG
jgi:hypothetical protein